MGSKLGHEVNAVCLLPLSLEFDRHCCDCNVITELDRFYRKRTFSGKLLDRVLDDVIGQNLPESALLIAHGLKTHEAVVSGFF